VQNAPEISSRDASATFSTKVNLVMVPVVVRDANGKVIGTLHKEDFQLFDKDKPQVITKFSVEKAGEAVIPAEVATEDAALENGAAATAANKTPSPIAQRFAIYLFDDLHTNIGDLTQVGEAADHYLSESLDATMRIAIFTASGLGNLDFTDDRHKLHEALAETDGATSTGPRRFRQAPGTYRAGGCDPPAGRGPRRPDRRRQRSSIARSAPM
jgi:VWFA-related protein